MVTWPWVPPSRLARRWSRHTPSSIACLPRKILVAGNFTILTDRGCSASPQTSRPRDLTITGLFNNNVLFTIICIQDITSAYNFALLIVPPIPILKTSTLVQKKNNKTNDCSIQHYYSIAYDQSGFSVGLFTNNARLAKSHVVMSCKLFNLWLL